MSLPVTERDSLRWTILALISVSHIIGAAAQHGINTLAPFYQQDLQLSRAQIGLFFTAFYLGMAGLCMVGYQGVSYALIGALSSISKS